MIDIASILTMKILTKVDKNISNIELLLILFLIGINYNNFIIQWFKYVYNKIKIQYTEIEIIGWESLNDGLYTFEYPKVMTAINYYIYSIQKSNNFRYFNNKRNGIYYADSIKETIENEDVSNFMLGNVHKINIEDDIYISVITDDTNNTTSDKKTIINWKISMKIISYKNNTKYIQDFINRCIIKYEKHLSNNTNNKIYHFIYQGIKNNSLSFSSKIISDLNDSDQQNYETFDNIFHNNKQQIIDDINRLHNIDYYKKTGLKRKKGYMFYGLPGTGKTSTVMAMSNYDKRHIIEIPISRVHTNYELETILSLTSINNVDFLQENIIILFDELDIKTKYKIDIIEKKKKQFYHKNDDINDDKQIDKLNISTLLSRFDGIGNYNGLIIVATTNNIDNIDGALYRDGRLNLIQFENATIVDIQNIIEKYYDCKLTNKLLDDIKELDKKISHAKIRCKLEYFNLPELLIEHLLI
jgi:ATP-dependent 26S proteasome regulatory subunit